MNSFSCTLSVNHAFVRFHWVSYESSTAILEASTASTATLESIPKKMPINAFFLRKNYLNQKCSATTHTINYHKQEWQEISWAGYSNFDHSSYEKCFHIFFLSLFCSLLVLFSIAVVTCSFFIYRSTKTHTFAHSMCCCRSVTIDQSAQIIFYMFSFSILIILRKILSLNDHNVGFCLNNILIMQ